LHRACLPGLIGLGAGWVHEIKHDGFQLMVRRDAAGVRLITRNGHDWSDRFPLIAQAAGALGLRSCLIDGEAVACDGDGIPSFDLLRYRRADDSVFMYAFDPGCSLIPGLGSSSPSTSSPGQGSLRGRDLPSA
jgi:ATP-dependent DNA ligase